MLSDRSWSHGGDGGVQSLQERRELSWSLQSAPPWNQQDTCLSMGQAPSRWSGQGELSLGSRAGLTDLEYAGHQVNNLLTGNPVCQKAARR